MRLSLDDFYRDRSHLSEKRRSRINFDHPRAIDWLDLERVLGKFAAGRSVQMPHYDFATHTRAARREPVKPKSLIIMDGLWLLRRPAVRKLFSHRIFIECPFRLRLFRRIRRDLAERGRTAANVKRQFLRQVVPMHDRFVSPQLRWADIVVTDPDEIEITSLARRIKTLLTHN
jgi:uridine kinase